MRATFCNRCSRVLVLAYSSCATICREHLLVCRIGIQAANITYFGTSILIQSFLKPFNKVWQLFLPLLSHVRFPLCQQAKSAKCALFVSNSCCKATTCRSPRSLTYALSMFSFPAHLPVNATLSSTCSIVLVQEVQQHLQLRPLASHKTASLTIPILARH